jgi:choline dehydrogenase-like flavoprotein
MSMANQARFDTIVVGSGPAGVSAAYPLVDAGVRVLMVDGGKVPDIGVPTGEYLATRATDPAQWQWMVGRDFRVLHATLQTSPKFRASSLAYVFRGFTEANRIEGDGFVPVGSLAVGGLSNAWGCGVARFSALELKEFPFSAPELLPSYAAVAQRIGISGRTDDDLTDFFGVDEWAQPPVPADSLHEDLLRQYARHRNLLAGRGFRLGRARVAVLNQARPGTRRPCSQCGFCLWGCAEESLYSARYDLSDLTRHANFTHRQGFIVDHLERQPDGWGICGVSVSSGSGETLRAHNVVLAAGTLATTSIALRSLPAVAQVPLLNLPMATFMLWLPKSLGAARTKGPGFAQLAFALGGSDAEAICGFTFSTHALPVAEFIRHVPLTRRHAITLLSVLLSSTVVANCFFPGAQSRNRAKLEADGTLRVTGGTQKILPELTQVTAKRLRAAFMRCGAWLLPSSFRLSATGSDVHYAGSLPMRQAPGLGETDRHGELAGLPGVFVADAAALPALPSKSHTLAMMACADRLGRELARRIRQPAH